MSYTFYSKIDPLDELLVLPVEDVEMGPVISGRDVVEVEAVNEAADVAPLGADHHVVVRLVPEVVAAMQTILS